MCIFIKRLLFSVHAIELKYVVLIGVLILSFGQFNRFLNERVDNNEPLEVQNTPTFNHVPENAEDGGQNVKT